MKHLDTVWDLEEIVEYHEGELDRVRPMLNQAVMELRKEIAVALETNDPLAVSLAEQYRVSVRRAG